MTRRAGFTLIEVMVSLVIGVIVLGVAVGLASSALRGATRARARSELARENAFAALVMTNDLRQAGAGVPRGAHVQQSCGVTCVFTYGSGARPSRFRSSVISATASQVAIVGDVARPNSQLPALGFLARKPTGRRDSIMWHTENNGVCAPTEPSTCGTGASSLLFPGEDGCATIGAAADRTCPWGGGRVVAGERLQIVAGNQNWSHTAVSTPLELVPPAPAHMTLGLRLSTSFDQSTPEPVWPNTGASTPPMGQRGAGWVTSLDRVFFVQNGDRLQRVQCRGDPDPGHADWGAPATLEPDTTLPHAPNVCGPPETIARHVSAFRLVYFASGIALPAPLGPTDLARVDRIDFELTSSMTVNDRLVADTTEGSVYVHAFEI